MGGCSDDSFEYFRAWLIAQSRDYFGMALSDLQGAARRIKPGHEVHCEPLIYVAMEAYGQKTESELPPSDFKAPTEPEGEEWDEDSVTQLYPKLAKKFMW